MSEFRRPRSLFFPLLLVAVGVFIFLINIGTIQGTTWDNLLQYWPVILIIGGLDGLYKRDGWVGPLVLIGLGTVLLLGNLKYLTVGGFTLFLRLWPILLVAIGLDIAFGHRGTVWNNVIRIFLGVLLVGGIVWLAMASPFGVGMKAVPFSQSLDSATSSNVTFSVAAGELNLSGGADKSFLLSGTAGLPVAMELNPQYSKPVDGKSTLSLEGNGVVVMPTNASTTPWNFKLNSSIPIDLISKLAVGRMIVDLSSTNVENLKTDMGVGQAIITVPEGLNFEGDINGAVGELIVIIPKGAQVTITTNNALVSVQFPAGYVRNGNLIRSSSPGSGAKQINLTIDLAVGAVFIREAD
jgi:hypothetical protein